MEKKSLEQLQRLSDEIREEEMSILLEGMAKTILMEQGDHIETEDPRKQTEREKYASLLLRSIRIHLCLDLIKQGHSSCINVLKEDWNEIIGSLKFLDYDRNDSNELLSNAVDIVLLLDMSKRGALLRLFDFTTRLKIKKKKPLPLLVAKCAFHMAEYCIKTNRQGELFRIAENLINLSEERNAGDLQIHRAITVQALHLIVDDARELTVRLCDEQRKYFDKAAEVSACHFFWFYSFSLLNLGRRKTGFPLLKYCYDLCMKLEGDTSWIGVRAGTLYHYQLLTTEKAQEAENYLWDSLKKIDSGFYEDMDNTADFVAASTRSVLLTLRMNKQNLRGLLPEIQRFRDYCGSVEDTNLSPNLTVRHAENFLAGYYLEAGDYLQAVDHSLNALNSIPPNGLPKEPSDILIYSNLLLIYTALNDFDQIDYYVQKLIDLSGEYEDDEFIMSRVSLMINTALKKAQLQSDDLEEDRQFLLEFYQGICNGEVEPAKSTLENISFSQWVLDLCSSVLDSFTADREELIRIRKIVNYFVDRPEVYKYNDIQKCTCFALLTQIEWQFGSSKALHYLEKCLHYVKSISDSREVKISILRLAAVIYFNYGRTDLSVSVIEEVLSGVTTAWQKATAYLNDHRVCQLLSFIQLHFSICYALLRACTKPEDLYQRVLQFKDLPALVGRERNRLLRTAPVDEHLKKQIFEKQDQLAAAELNDSLNGTNNAQKIAVQLERLETMFEAQFPQNLYFTEISFDRVCDKLPDHCAIIEYYFTLGEKALSGRPYEQDALELDIFVASKKHGRAKLDYLKIKRGDIILEQAERFIGLLQDSGDVSTSGEKASLRAELYRKLIAPILPFLDEIDNLYIAPHDQLCNLPFEILYADGHGLLQDEYKICRLVCGRDLLFYDNSETTGGSSFILGNPDYEAERGERISSKTRSVQKSLNPVSALPFSGVEAVRIGRRCHTRIYTGNAATKYALQDALPCSIIHLATHGIFDDQMEADSLYASHLVFAGYNKWVSNGTESHFCGNGVLTADEISRMDLKKTELVVLSACQSGLGDTSYGSVRGLISAFSAAGARWIISHMWETDDFSAPILMDAFYDAYRNKGRDVPDALQYAKDYLRTVTIGTLRREGWLDLPGDIRFSDDIRLAIADMRGCPNDIKPFEDEFYWGGFTAHKSR